MLERHSATSTPAVDAPVVKVAAKGGPKIVVAAKDGAPSRLSKMIVAAGAGALNASVKAVAAPAAANVRDLIGFPHRTTEPGSLSAFQSRVARSQIFHRLLNAAPVGLGVDPIARPI